MSPSGSLDDTTPELIVDGIVRALNQRNIGMVPILVRLLAVKDPQRAVHIYDAMAAGIVLSDRYDLYVDTPANLALDDYPPAG